MQPVQRQGARSAAAIAVLGAVLALALVGAGLLVEAVDPGWDALASRRWAGWGGRAGEIVSLGLSRVGDVPGVAVAVLAAFAVARRRGRWRDLAFVAVAATTELLVFLTVSEAVGRPRPQVPSPDAAPFTGAFPSGHTAIALVILGALALVLPPVAGRTWRRFGLAGALVGASLVGLARIVRGQHRPSEVLAGLVLGGAVVAIVYAVARHEHWSPTRAPAGEPRRAPPTT